MSRSYKHTPYCGDRKNKFMKRYANKRVRQRLKNSDYLPTAAEYKKMFESYVFFIKKLQSTSFEVFLFIFQIDRHHLFQ